MADLEQNQPLLQAHPTPSSDPSQAHPQPKQRRPNNAVFAASVSFGTLLLLSLAALTFNGGGDISPPPPPPVSRGKKEGVSEKAFRAYYDTFAWTNEMLQWQRTGFHFQPQKNWMNDPNGPLYHKGYYHLFYQYNPDSAVWGNITWGHAVSTDLIHWKYLPISMVPDHWYDINGVWSGSATILPNGTIVMLYTGSTAKSVQVQNLAYPANLSDPLLLKWVKYSGNPVMTPPEGIGKKDFRDPTTAWVGPDGVWRLTIGSRDRDRTGFSLVYKTTDFVSYELVDHRLHQVLGTGMWECVDFFPVSTQSENGLDTSAYGPGIKHFLKASLDDEKIDYYALGTYDMATETWVPDNPDLDVGIGLKVDYGGKYYASKTFYDPVKGRRILWGWMGETDSEDADLLKGWASVQTIPRVVTYDRKTQANVIQWPVEELEELRSESIEFENVVVKPGSILNLDLTSAAQLDIIAEFSVDSKALRTVGDDVINNCSAAAKRQALGPFGLLVLADKSLSEFTPVYFHIAKASDGTVKNWFCTDLSRSSLGSGVDKQVHGGPVPVLEGEKYNMRLLVDHSIVEGFGQGGRTCTTTRIYPTKAINGAARVFLFNNATDVSVTASVKIWRLKSAEIGPF